MNLIDFLSFSSHPEHWSNDPESGSFWTSFQSLIKLRPQGLTSPCCTYPPFPHCSHPTWKTSTVYKKQRNSFKTCKYWEKENIRVLKSWPKESDWQHNRNDLLNKINEIKEGKTGRLKAEMLLRRLMASSGGKWVHIVRQLPENKKRLGKTEGETKEVIQWTINEKPFCLMEGGDSR